MKSSSLNFLGRFKVIIVCVTLFSLVLVSKVFLVQIVHGGAYGEIANRQYATQRGDIYERGTVFFKRQDGQLVSAATQTTGFKLAIDPKTVTGSGNALNIEDIYQSLSAIVVLDHDDFMLRAGKTSDPYEEVATHLSKEQADAVSALKISGINIFKEKWRFYPGGSLASHALGLVAYRDNELGGRYGLERQYDEELSRNESDPYINFFAEVFSNLNKTLFDSSVREGDVVTTIEPEVQNFMERKLVEVKERYQADSIGAIIMNPADGSIYAMGVKPDFDPNNFSQIKKTSTFSNPLVENVLEFGSVVKPLVMAAALDAGAVTALTTYNDKGSIIVEKKEIFNFDKKARGVVNMQEVLNQSLNTGMVFIEQKLGKEKMRDYLLAYGIKDKTGIDLPNETSGLVSNLNSPREIEYANASFGQGIALTPIEMVRALASLGNGGNLVVPHVVEKIKYDDGTWKTFTYPTIPTKITKKTGEEITRMLVNVMDKSLKGGLAKLERFSVAIKTGTAQVANPTDGGYYEDKHTHSFVGYFPAYDPKFIVFLYALDPKGVQYAAETWADPFLDITKFLLNYYEVAPDR